MKKMNDEDILRLILRIVTLNNMALKKILDELVDLKKLLQEKSE